MKIEVDNYETYDAAKERLDAIVTDVRDKDISLEASIDLLEEGVALANKCTELIDVSSWQTEADNEDESVEDKNDVHLEGNSSN